MMKKLLATALLTACFGSSAFGQTTPGQTLQITPSAPVISAGAVTVTSGSVTPVPESSATTDTIVTINGGRPGERITIRAPSGKELHIDDGAGNIVLRDGDAFLDNDDSITLQKIGTDWHELIRSVETFTGGNASFDSLYELARAVASGSIAATTPTRAGTLSINGEDLGTYSLVRKEGNQTTTSFTSSDWFTSDEDDNCAFVVVNGNWDINNSQIVRPPVRKLCMVVYVTGNLTFGSGTALGNNPFTTTINRRTITVAHTAHGKSVGDVVSFSGASAVGGVTITGEYIISTVPNADSYTFVHTNTATGSATGGGASVVYTSGLSMTARGANHGATGSNIPAVDIQIIEGTHSAVTDPYVGASGGVGDDGTSAVSGGGAVTDAGDTGGTAASAGTFSTGGGGSGGARATSGASAFGGAGATGTSFSGGAGGGAAQDDSGSIDGGDGVANGGAGGFGAAGVGSAAGGAGNPGGTSTLANAGTDGTGGTLIVIVEGEISGVGTIAANGSPGGYGISGDASGGGGSGGGHATALAGSYDATNPTTTAKGGSAGEETSSGAEGGFGGAGTARELVLDGAGVWSGWDQTRTPRFTDLVDGPRSYNGKADELLKVEATEDRVGYIAPADLIITADGTTEPRDLASRFSDVIDVRNYTGAVSDCTATSGTDSTAAIQEAIDDVPERGALRLTGSYCVTSLDLTSFDRKSILAWGGILYGIEDIEGGIVDATGASGVGLYGLRVLTQDGVTPRNGIQFGRLTNGAAATFLQDVSVFGNFELAALAAMGSDFSYVIGSDFNNLIGNSDAYGAVISSSGNLFTTYSPFHTRGDVSSSHQDVNAVHIESITNASPAVVTTAEAHQIDDDEFIRFRGIVGVEDASPPSGQPTSLNGTLKATPSSPSTVFCAQNPVGLTFEVYLDDCTTPFDSRTAVGDASYSAHTADTGLVGGYVSSGTSEPTFMNTSFGHIDGPAALLGPALGVGNFKNCYFSTIDSATDASVVILYDDQNHGNMGIKSLTVDCSVEDGTTDHGYTFMAESGFFEVQGFTGKDQTMNVGTAYFYAVPGLTVQLDDFAFDAGGIDNDELFDGNFRITGMPFMDAAGASWIGAPTLFNGFLVGQEADHNEFGAGSVLMSMLQMDNVDINYLPLKGEIRFIGTAAESYGASTLDSETDITRIDGDGVTLQGQGLVNFMEAAGGGGQTLSMQAPAAVTSNQTCTFENDASFIPDSCVGNGTDDTGTFDASAVTSLSWGTNNFTTEAITTNGEDFSWDYTTIDGQMVLTLASGGAASIVLGDQGILRFREEVANGVSSMAFQAPAAITTGQTCTFEDDASFIPDSCVGDGTDAGGGVGGSTGGTDNAILRADGTGGSTLQSSVLVIADTSGAISGAASGFSIEFFGAAGTDTTLTAPAAGRLQIEGAEIFTVAGAGLTNSTQTLAVGAGTCITSNANDVAITADCVGPTQIDETASFDWTGIHTFDSDAVQIDDTNASHQLVLTPGSDLSADRVFTITTGDAARTLTISANATLNDADYGDITTSSSFTSWNIDSGVVGTAEVTDGNLLPADLDVDADTPGDEECLTYETTGTDFEWQACGGGGLANVVEDTTPQLGGDLDANTFWVGFDDATGIEDENGNEQIVFQTTGSAANYVEITNAAAGADPTIGVNGSDTDIGLILTAKGTDNVRFTRHAVPGSDGSVGLGTSILGWDNVFLDDDNGCVSWGAEETICSNGTNGMTIDGATLTAEVIVPDGDNTRAFGSGAATWSTAHITSVELGNGTTDTLTSTGGLPTVESVSVKMAGRETVWIPAGSMKSAIASGADCGATYDSGSNDVAISVCNFDSGASVANERAEFQIAMPKNWNESTLQFQPLWTNTAGLTTETAIFTLSCVAVSNSDTLNAAMGTPQSSSDTWEAQNELHIGPEPGTPITCAGTPAEGDYLAFRIIRDTTNDNMTGDVALLGIKLYYTTNAANDN